jgi:thiol-disulfide isomerase/thioredoxin
MEQTMKLIKLALLSFILLPPVVFAAQMKPYEGDTPALELKDTSGKLHQLSKYKGKIVLVQFWATYCTPCRTEMPSMNRLVKKMDGKLEILAINMGESKAEVEKFMQEVGVDFPVLMDKDGKALAQWKVFAAPSNFLIDTDSKIQYTLFGGVEWDSEEMVEFLRKLNKSE